MKTAAPLNAVLFVVLPAIPITAAEIWSPNPCVAVFKGPDYSGKDDAECAIRIVGTPNGAFTGQVVVYSKEPMKLEPASVTDLKQKEGEAVIPASRIAVRYALPSNSETGAYKRFKGVNRRALRRFDALAEKSQESASTHPVWLIVSVPADARPGEYEGTLSVAGRKIPVRLKVCSWKLPDPIDYITHVNIIQSPETVALRYEVPMWSEKHFELLGRTFDHLARVGNKVIYIPLICHTHFGNSEGMVRWKKDGEGWAHDYSIAEKYLDLYIERIGKPAVVCLYVWDSYAGGAHFGRDKGTLGGPIKVSKLDPESGNVEVMEGPAHGAPDSPAFWKPVMDGIRERCHKREIKDESIMIGIGGDNLPNKATVNLFYEVAPYARWVVNAHGRTTKLYKKVAVGLLAHVWGTGSPPDPDKEPDRKWKKKRYYGWRHKQLITAFPRFAGQRAFMYPALKDDAPLGGFRSVCEYALGGKSNLRGMNGIGRVAADFWGALKDEKGRRRSLLNRYPYSNWHQLTVSNATAAFLYPGPDGALSTVRYEMFREGVQECEAKIFLEKVLIDKEKRAKLGEEAAAKYDELLNDRIRKMREAHPGKKRWEWYATESGWQDRTVAIYEAAAEMQKATAGGGETPKPE